MKKLLLTLLMGLCIFAASAQEETSSIYKYRATSYAFMDKTVADPEFDEWEDCNVLIVVNLETDRINIYSKVDQVFDITEYGEWESEDDGSRIWKITAVDADGKNTTLTFRNPKEKDSQLQLYVNYSNVRYVYSLKFLN